MSQMTSNERRSVRRAVARLQATDQQCDLCQEYRELDLSDHDVRVDDELRAHNDPETCLARRAHKLAMLSAHRTFRVSNEELVSLVRSMSHFREEVTL